MWIRLVPYAAAALFAAYVSWYVTSNSYDDDIDDLNAQHAAALSETQKSQIAECKKAQSTTEKIDHETQTAKAGTDAAYIYNLERMLTKARADFATCRANASSASIPYGQTEAGLDGTCVQDGEILRLGYDGQTNGELATGLQKYVCEVKPDSIGCQK